MSIDDPIEKQLEDLASIGEPYLPKSLALHATSIAVPIIGGVITRVKAGAIQRRLVERLDGLFREFKKRLEDTEQNKIDREFFYSAEFQTLLILAIQQAHATHDEERLRYLGAVLANSGNLDFAKEHRKEIFLRVMRDLTPDHMRMLGDLSKGSVVRNPIEEDAYLCRSLTALGLVHEFRYGGYSLEQREPYALIDNTLEETLEGAVACFRITQFGHDFVKFIGESPHQTR